MKGRVAIVPRVAHVRVHLAVVFALTAFGVDAQTVNYTMQTGNFNQLREENNTSPPFAGTYNASAADIGQYANSGGESTPGAAAFQTFSTTGNGVTGSARALQVGDSFTITGYTATNPSVGGYVGISFRDSTAYTNFSSATDSDTELRFQLDNTGGWKVYNAGSAIDSGLGANSDRTFTITVTSGSTFNAFVGSNPYRNLGMAAGGGSIDSFAVYTYGNSNANSFWKNASLTSTGVVELGYALPSGIFTPGVVSDGLEANSTSTVKANAVFIGGDAGSQVNLVQANTYTGTTTVNFNAAGEAQHADALGSTAAGTVVSTGGALKLYSPTGISYAAEPLTLNGVGVSGVNGSLRSVGGTNAWNGAITLNANSRINADTSGGSGSLTIAGNVAGGGNVLFVGANGAPITVSGTISGSGNAEGGTTTSLFKDGASTLTLSGNNTYTGDTRITSGTLTVASGGSLGNGSDVFVSTGAVLNVASSVTVASLQETGVNNVGTAIIGSGAVLTINGSGFNAYQGSISGGGGLTIAGSGTTNLFDPQTYSGTTSVSAGRLTSTGSMSTAALVVTGGVFATGAANILPDSLPVTLSAGGVFGLGANETIGSFSGTAGTVAIGAHSLTVVGSQDRSFGGEITGSGLFIKDGTAALTLNGSSSAFAGTTIVQTGTLNLAAGSLGGSFDVETGAVLAGDLTIAANESLGGDGTVAGDVFFASGAYFDFALGNTLVVTGGTVSFGGFGMANVAGLSSSTPDGTYTLISGPVNFANVSNVGAANAYGLGGGRSAYFQEGSLQVVIVPEPSSLALLVAGGGIAAGVAHHRRRRSLGRGTRAGWLRLPGRRG